MLRAVTCEPIPLYTGIHQAARLLGHNLAADEIRDLIRAGRLRAYRVQGRCVVRFRDVVELVEREPWPPGEPVPEARIGP